MTARSVAWLAGAAGSGAALREVLRAGPRYGEVATQSPTFFLSGAAGGAACAAILMRDFDITRGRRTAYTAVAGAAGAFLPAFLALVGPHVRARLQQYLPAGAGGSGGGGSGSKLA
jgi:hypothetical protein